MMLEAASFPVALAMMLGAMVCWGSWTNTYRLARAWPVGFFHADYALGVFLAGALAGAGSLDNLRAAGSDAWFYALSGGAALNIGNYLLMAAIPRVGMTVAFPVSVGFALVVSTVLSYLVTPLGDPLLLSGGVALVFCAVLTNSLVYRSAGAKSAGSGRGGLAMCFAAGVLFSICGPLVAKALAAPRPLRPAAAALLYGSGGLVAAVPLILFLVPRPLEYFRGSHRNHAAGVAGGAIWGAGMVMAFLAAGLVGMAISGAIGQANPLVAAAWGIFVWHEFRGARRRTHLLLALMIALYASGLALLALSFQ